MAKYRALVSFTGSVSMAMGEVREIPDTPIVENLVKVGYLMEVEKPVKAEPKEETETETVKKKSPRRKEK